MEKKSSLEDIYKPEQQADVREVVSTLKKSISESKPFSLIRYGDGEGFLSGYPDITDDLEYSLILRLWWGEEIPDEEPYLRKLRERLAESVLNADVLGVPNISQGKKFKKALEVLDKRRLVQSQRITSADIHRELYESDGFNEILSSLDFVGLITCRDIKATIQDSFGIKDVSVYSIPEEAAYARDELKERHYPERFYQLEEIVRVPFPGAVFLIGAGVCGKVYCNWIKAQGGIAIDLGSVFDIWANRITRAYMRNSAFSATGKDWELNKYKSLARSSAKEGEFEAAVKHQLLALNVAPYDPLVYFELSQYYEKLNMLEEALTFAEKAHTYRPDNPHLKEHYIRLKNI